MGHAAASCRVHSCFAFRIQSRADVAQTTQPAKSQIVRLGPFTENICRLRLWSNAPQASTCTQIVWGSRQSVEADSACGAGPTALYVSLPGHALEQGMAIHSSVPAWRIPTDNPHGQRSLAGYSPRGRKQSDATERLSRATPEPWASFPRLSFDMLLGPIV